MIESFKSRPLKLFWQRSDASKINPKWLTRVALILDALDAAERPEALDMPGLAFHRLRGSRKRAYAVTVSGNWRITFEFEGESARNVNLEDYHGS